MGTWEPYRNAFFGPTAPGEFLWFCHYRIVAKGSVCSAGHPSTVH